MRGIKIDITCLGDPARTFEHIVILAVFGILDLDDLVDRCRKVGQFHEIMCSAAPSRLASSHPMASALKPPYDPSFATTTR
ncbi:MAG TPA: hypothetical protein VLJ17_05710 [Xanthobacteraceae bacterium]|nr:hypothetical protein [Xanthobacteraceae bacterium]